MVNHTSVCYSNIIHMYIIPLVSTCNASETLAAGDLSRLSEPELSDVVRVNLPSDVRIRLIIYRW